MRNRRVQLLLVILSSLTAIFLGHHLLSGRVGQGSASPKRAVAAPFRPRAAREGSGLPNGAKSTASPVDSLNARFKSASIANQESPITNSLVPLSSIQNPKSKIQNVYGQLPLSFEANRGQTDAQVKFLARGPGYTLFLTADEAVFVFRGKEANSKLAGLRPMDPAHRLGSRLPTALRHGLLEPVEWFGRYGLFGLADGLFGENDPLWPPSLEPGDQVTTHASDVLRMKLVGADSSAKLEGIEEMPGKSNYFIGNDPKKWRTNVPTYRKVAYKGVYPGIDLVYYGNRRQLEYDFVVAPGADPNQIRLALVGAGLPPPEAAQQAAPLQVDPNGDLVAHIGDGEIRFHRPLVYQPLPSSGQRITDNGRLTTDRGQLTTDSLQGHFMLEPNNQIRFQVSNYDRTKPLVIDPVLTYSTLLGGTGYDQASAIAVDASGNAYITGWTDSTDFPQVNPASGACLGTCSTNPQGFFNAFVSKLSFDGSALKLVYSCVLGGSDHDEGYGIAMDASGSAYVTGWTASNDFPQVNPAVGACAGTCSDKPWHRAFISKLSFDGSTLALPYSTLLGGSSDEEAHGIAVDSAGNAYVAGYTSSLADFPQVNTASGACTGCSTSGYIHAFVTKLSFTGSILSLAYSTLLGGSNDFRDLANSIAVDASGAAYVTGYTSYQRNFPQLNPAPGACAGTCETDDYAHSFVSKLGFDGSHPYLAYSTLLGGSGEQFGNGIAVDAAGSAFVTGYTWQTADFPEMNPAPGACVGTCGTGTLYDNAFIAKLSFSGSALTLVYSTLLGGSGNDKGYGITVDASGSANVTGYNDSSDFPQVNPPSGAWTASSAFNTAFVTKLSFAAPQLTITFSTLLGGSSGGNQWGNGVAVDVSGAAYVAGQTDSAVFPQVNAAPQACVGTCGSTISNGDAFVAKISLSTPTVGAVGGTYSPQATVAEPVATGNGNYFYQHTDLVIPGRGIPLVFQRSYNALDNYSGPLGANWTHSYNIVLTETVTAASVKWGDGHTETYTLSGGVYIPQPGVFNTLIQNPDGTFVLTQKNQTRYLFSATGTLTSIADKNGNTIQLTYNGAGSLTQITDTVGRNLALSYDGSNRITRITDPIGRTTLFSYSGTNDLTQVTDSAGGATQFAYDASHHVTSITLPNNQILLQNTYDGVGRVISQTNGRGFTTTFAYDTPAARNTTITDARGKQTVHTYDASLRITTITDALGGIVGYGYDANNDRTSIKNQDGNTTTFAYDADGNMTSITDPLGNNSSFTYDAKNDLLAATNPKGKATSFSYDANGNLLTIQDALGNTTTFAYHGSGELSSKTDARGGATAYGYDSLGNLTHITDGLGDITTLGYDGIGRLTTLTDPNHHTATSTYDSLSRLTTVTDPLGHQTRFVYDAVGNLQKVTDANGHVTSYAYDAVNNLVKVTDALGHVTQYAYDPNNNRTAFTNAKGNATSYAYEALNRLSSITDPLSFVTTYAYDPVGNVTAVKDANGKTNQFAYDALNRLLSISYADGKNVTYAYDVDGNRTTMLDSHGTTVYAYDALDRLINVTFPGSKTVAYGHDAVGNRSSLPYPDGKLVNYAYDAGNRLTGVTDWLGRMTGYSYDAAGNLLGIAYPPSLEFFPLSPSGDATSNPLRIAYPNIPSIAFTYDAANRLTSVANSMQGALPVVIAYTLDAVGNRTKKSVNGVATLFAYDALNELVSARVGPPNATWTYDAVGNRLTQTSPLGATTYTYDAGDRLLAAGLAKFKYDNDGNQLTKTSGHLTWTYTYDAANRLIKALGYGMNSTFGYDGDGNRVSQTSGPGTYSYVNDVATALPVVLNEQGPDGNISYAYGLSLIEESSPKFNFFYHYDGLGSVIALTDGAGRPRAAYAYDPWGNAPLSVPDSVGTKNKFRFTGEALDPGTGFYYLRARYYDPSLSRFMRKDPLLGLVYQPRTMQPYLYVGNNPLLLKDPLGLCPDCVQSTLSPSQLSPAQQYDNDMLVRGDDIIEQQITNTILDAAGAALSLVGIPGLGPTVSLLLQQPTELQRIEAFSNWAVDNTLLQTPSGRDFLRSVGEGKVTAILLTEGVYNTKQKLQQIGIPPDVISLLLSGLDVK